MKDIIKRRGVQRVAWFVALYAAGIVTITIVAYGIRALIIPS